MPSDPDDHQRSRLYEAQDVAFPHEKVDHTLDELQTLANDMIASVWWKRCYPHVRSVVIKDGRGSDTSRTGQDGKSVQMKKGQRLRYLLVHEMAHLVDTSLGEDHGAVYAALFLFLVGRAYSTNAKRRLAKEFREREIVWDRKIARMGRP